MTTKRLLTVQEACRYLGISRTTLLKTEEEGLITSTRTVGGHRRYARETLDQYLRATTGLRARALSVTRDTHERMLLPRVVERLAQASAPADDIMKDALEDLVQLLQADAGFIALLDGHNVLRPRVTSGLILPPTLQLAPNLLDSTVSGRVLKLQHPLVYADSDCETAFEGLTQGVCAPLTFRGVPLGVIHILSLSRHQFLPTELQFLSLIALYLASLVVNAQVLADSRQREEELACLNRLGQSMQEQSELHDMADTLLNEAMRITAADLGLVLLRGDGTDVRLIATQGLSPSLEAGLEQEFMDVVTRLMDSQQAYYLFPSASHDLVGLASILGKIGSALLMPLRAQQEELGVLLLGSRSHRDTAQWRVSFLGLACAQAALVVQRAALCHHLACMSETERNLRRRYEKMIAVAPVAMEIIDKDCKIIGWNEAAAQLTGIPKEEALGADKFRLQPALLKYRGREILKQVFESRQTVNVPQFPYERRDGTVRYTDLTFLPFVDDNGEATAIILFAQIVTEIHRLRLAADLSSVPQPRVSG